MTVRNLTIQLDDEVIRQAKVLAARRRTSVSALVARELSDLVERDARYEVARVAAMALLEDPPARGGRGWTRDDLYDRPVMTRG